MVENFLEAMAINESYLTQSPIEEIWLIRDGICIFHDFWTSTPLDLNIQLFSAFTTADNSFSKNTLPSEQLRNIDFQNTTLVLESLPEFSILFVIKFSSISTEKQIQIIKLILSDIKLFITYEIHELFAFEHSSLPLTAYSKPLSNFFKNFMLNLNENEREIRKIDLLSILQIAENLYTVVSSSTPDFSNSEIDSLNLDNVFNSIIFSTGLSTDNLPTLSSKDLKLQFYDFISNVRSIVKKNLSHDLKDKLMSFFIKNYQIIKYYDLDETFVLNLLTVFHEQ